MNKGNTLIIGTIFGLLISAYLFVFFQEKNQDEHSGVVIAVIQSATHPALDDARIGFIETINKILPETIIMEKNGERSVSALHAIMDEVQSIKYIDLFYAIGTPALSAVAHREKEKPIVFTAVTDPTILHLEAQNNLCGVTDAVDEQKVLSTVIKTFSPKKVAILFDPAESNSVLSKNRMLSYARDNQIAIVEYAVSSSLDIQTAIEHMENIDCVVLPTDNLLASAISLITRLLAEKQIPCVSFFPVANGVAFYVGVDYYDAGCQAAHIAASIVKGEITANEIGFMKDKKQIIQYNNAVLATFGITKKN